MLERINDQDIYVRNYTSNFDVKEFIQDVLVPKAFPDIPLNKLNLGFTGITSEMISTAIEDAYATASLMLNEAFITRAVLPSSIYSEASLFDLGYTFATPSRCNFALQLWAEDVIEHSYRVRNTPTRRYHLDKDTELVLGDITYRLDYDIIIDHQFIDGRVSFNTYYDMNELNSIAITHNKHVKHQNTSLGWLVLFVELQEFDRKVEENYITDNLRTTNSDIYLRWYGQIAGMDLVYVTPDEQRVPMIKKIQHTRPEHDPFCWYSFYDDDTLRLMFSNSRGYFQPEFNSRIESTIYICNGKSANFDSYDANRAVPVETTHGRFEYNSDTRMVALCYGGSRGGADRGDIELLRDDIIVAHNTVDVLTTDNDLNMWFKNYARRHNTKAYFFKRRDDPTGKLFSQFVAITKNNYVYPTNTLTLDITQKQFDFVNNDAEGINKEFIIKPGHLWQYVGDSRDTVEMVDGVNGLAMITDEVLPPINDERPFMFVNPFYIKIHRQPSVSANYNYLLNHVSWPEDVPINTDIFYQFQLANLTIKRSLSREYENKYRIQIVCIPTVSQDTIDYIEGYGEEFNIRENNLRIVLISRSRMDGETGYIEMRPVEELNGGAMLFETEIAIDDNLRTDMMLEIDKEKTPQMISLIANGPRKGRIFVDSAETSFHFAVMIKDVRETSTTRLYNDTTFQGYVMANRFANDHRGLTLYQPMNMMRSTVTFGGKNDDYKVKLSLVPLLKYDVPLDEEEMLYFIRTFSDQYTAVEPVLKRLDGNSYLDFKLFNTYGRSSNYYVGPPDDSDILWDSEELLDNVYVSMKWKMAVWDRSTYVQTVEAVINEIQLYFEALHTEDLVDIHISQLIHVIKENHPNVHYIRFLGFNDYDARKQSIFVKYDHISELKKDQLQIYVPEMIRVDARSISIVEEI